MDDLREKMKRLIKLQECDIRIRNVQAGIGENPKRIEELGEKLRNLEEQVDQGAVQFEECTREKREIDQRIDDIENRLKKSQVKLSNIASNKEYTAALKEISDLEREKSALEDKALDLMERREDLKTTYDSFSKEAEENKIRFLSDQEKIRRNVALLEKELVNLQKERAHCRQAVDVNLLKQYDFLKIHKGVVVVSPVAESVCKVCNIGIPPQQFNELIRGDTVMTCPNCKRIIYWGEDKCYNGQPLNE